MALFSGENDLPGYECNAVKNVSGRFRRKFQRNANGQYGAGSFYGSLVQYNDCINKGDLSRAKRHAHSALKAFMSGVLMQIALASSSAVKVWKDRSNLIRDAYGKIMGTDMLKHAMQANGAKFRGTLIKLNEDIVKNILAFIEKALAASEEDGATAIQIRAAWAMEQENNAEEDGKPQGLKAYPLGLVLKKMMANAKEKTAGTKDAQSKPGGKKFKAECVYNKCSTKQGDRK
jgi:hypothetical protein